MSKRFLYSSMLLILAGWSLAACGSKAEAPSVLRLATTTSVDNSGLLPAILPLFEAEFDAQVEVIAVGTGQALALGESGDVDAVLVHAPELEEAFVEDGYGTSRRIIMFNDFVIAGPPDDPAGIASAPDAPTALTQISASQSGFASRGDQSGTHFREQQVWTAAGMEAPEGEDWYFSVGQGMGSTLNFANEKGVYVLTDRGTFLAQSGNLPDLTVLFGGDSALENPDSLLYNVYSVIPVNPEMHPVVNYDLAQDFAGWITSVELQEVIGQFGLERFGMPLFYPDSEEWRSQSSAPDQAAAPVVGGRWSLGGGLVAVLGLFASFDSELWQIVGTTLRVSGTALALACLFGIPLGVAAGLGEFGGKRLVRIALYTGMGFPPVVVGLVTFLLLSNQGALGFLEWLFTLKGMVVAQTILALPLAAGLTMAAIGEVSPKLVVQIRSMGADRWQERWTVFAQARRGVVAAVLAALGRIISEVGAAMLVGGNIAGKTRVLSTAIVLETRQGDFSLALALGMVLLGVALVSNMVMIQLGGRWQS